MSSPDKQEDRDREPLRKKKKEVQDGSSKGKRKVGELKGENCRSIMEDYCAGAAARCGGARES